MLHVQNHLVARYLLRDADRRADPPSALRGGRRAVRQAQGRQEPGAGASARLRLLGLRCRARVVSLERVQRHRRGGRHPVGKRRSLRFRLMRGGSRARAASLGARRRRFRRLRRRFFAAFSSRGNRRRENLRRLLCLGAFVLALLDVRGAHALLLALDAEQAFPQEHRVARAVRALERARRVQRVAHLAEAVRLIRHLNVAHRGVLDAKHALHAALRRRLAHVLARRRRAPAREEGVVESVRVRLSHLRRRALLFARAR